MRRINDELPDRKWQASGAQNFLSAASGIAVLVAMIRASRSKKHARSANFWVDLTRATLYVLLPCR